MIYLPHGRLAMRRHVRLDLEQQRHDATFVRLILRKTRLVFDALHETAKLLYVLRLDVRQGAEEDEPKELSVFRTVVAVGTP